MNHALREELFKLTAAERLELVEELWDSIAADGNTEEIRVPAVGGAFVDLTHPFRRAAHRLGAVLGSKTVYAESGRRLVLIQVALRLGETQRLRLHIVRGNRESFDRQ